MSSSHATGGDDVPMDGSAAATDSHRASASTLTPKRTLIGIAAVAIAIVGLRAGCSSSNDYAAMCRAASSRSADLTGNDIGRVTAALAAVSTHAPAKERPAIQAASRVRARPDALRSNGTVDVSKALLGARFTEGTTEAVETTTRVLHDECGINLTKAIQQTAKAPARRPAFGKAS